MRGVKTKAGGKWKRLAVFFVLLLIFGLLVNSVTGVYQKKKNAEEFLARMQKEKIELERRNEELSTDLERLSTEEGVKFEIKRKLNVAEVGESVAIVVSDTKPATSTSATTSKWQKFKNWFGGLFD